MKTTPPNVVFSFPPAEYATRVETTPLIPANPVNNQPAISFSLLSPDKLESIRPLWEQLNQHHAALSSPFAAEIAARAFEPRLHALREKVAVGRMRVEIATAATGGPPVAYCISSLASDGVGEVDSLFVASNFRGTGIATTLMHRALDWLRDSGAVSRRVVVLHANYEAVAFYRRFGFYPRNVELEESPNMLAAGKATQ